MTGSADNPPRWLSLDEKKFYAIWTKAWHFPYYSCRAVGEIIIRGGGGRVFSNGFYADISSQRQMQQYKSYLK